MSLGFIRVASVSPSVSVGGVTSNCNEIIKSLKEASKDNAKIVLFPELAVCGYTCGDLFLQPSFIDLCYVGLCKIKDATKNLDCVAVIGAPIKHREKLFNCAVVIYKGNFVGIVPKSNLPNYDEYCEKRWFAEYEKLENTKYLYLNNMQIPFGTDLIFALNDETRFGIEICEDLCVPDAPSNELALNGANIILNPSASSECAGKQIERENLIKIQSSKLVSAYVYASSSAGESTTDCVFSGDKYIAENGVILSKGSRFLFDTSHISYDIDIQMLNYLRSKKNTFNIKDDYRIINISKPINFLTDNQISRQFNPSPFLPADEQSNSLICEEILNIQCLGLAKRMKHIKCEKLVVGVSGGLDSTLALLVADRTLKMLNIPSDNLLCITMPGFGTTDSTYQNACKLINLLGASLTEISIKDACIQHFKDINHDIDIHDITYENTQARERTQILMDMANKNNAILVGTGDLSELALGWCTYNGDQMSMYGVNSSIPKTMVRHLVKYASSICSIELSNVLENVLATPVSPELLPPDENGNIQQKTENVLCPYEVCDFFIYNYIINGYSPSKLLFTATKAFENAYNAEDIEKWLKLFLKRFYISQFKRSSMPDGPKACAVSFSPRSDLKLPSDVDFTDLLNV